MTYSQEVGARRTSRLSAPSDKPTWPKSSTRPTRPRCTDLPARRAALAAARRGCYVTASDFVPELLAAAQGRAKAEGLAIETHVTDAESQPFDDGRFDVALSTFGVMFTPDQGRAAAELRRVCRPGGRIGLASWTPESFVGQMFHIIGRYGPPPAGVPSPLDWGDERRGRPSPTAVSRSGEPTCTP
jgi:SAM-dependent methyltransferase